MIDGPLVFAALVIVFGVLGAVGFIAFVAYLYQSRDIPPRNTREFLPRPHALNVRPKW